MTTLTITASAPAQATGEALVLPLQPKASTIALAVPGLTRGQADKIVAAARALGATGATGEVTKIPDVSGIKAGLVVTVGLGDATKSADPESVRRAYGNAIRSLTGKRRIAVVLPAENWAAAVLGARLANYAFTAFKSAPKKESAPVQTIAFITSERVGAEQRAFVHEVGIIGDAVDLARDLVNTPPNALPPATLAREAKAAVAAAPVKVTIWDEKALQRDGCGGILAVGQGSVNPPRLVKLEYAPKGAKKHLAIVGKGITFDTGGISIKPAANMDEMKGDMAGAAAVIAAMQAIAALRLPVRVTGWVPSAENMPSGTAQRPGDVFSTYDGTTVEVLNTDAEGRLILADALGMAVEEKPDLIIDAATLTGAQRIALGSRTAGVMSNKDEARTQVCDAAEAAGEAMWPMPLPEDLRSSLDSATADIANIGDRMGGMLSAGVFLKEFIPAGQPWVHLDIAGPAFNDKAAYGYTPKGGTGAAVRTFVEMARRLANSR
jgi:leucyl aminopeptidase